MRTFTLNRITDITGVSGTGRVAQGIEFDNGKVAVTWLTGVSTVTVYDNIEAVEKINGHGGHTKIEYSDAPTLVVNGILNESTTWFSEKGLVISLEQVEIEDIHIFELFTGNNSTRVLLKSWISNLVGKKVKMIIKVLGE